ncbi:MAG: penicillin-binding transpeptidase domain-containing protein [Acutalibacteraceae bacterium]|nr:penicillin-binding transpeptidase domain-containing protein [Acutalibacteraceae bacterium]
MAVCFSFCGCNQKGETEFYSADLQLMGTFSKEQYESNSITTYIDIARSEAVDIIALKENISHDKAEKLLSDRQYRIYTYFDVNVGATLDIAYEKNKDKTDLAVAVADIGGNLLGAVGKTQETNFATKSFSPYSAFKPLSVYAPAIENGVINWSTVIEDSPYKTIEEDGQTRDWPSNSSGSYSYEKTTVSKAVYKSINTVAVKTLKKLGVNNSIEFLTYSFNVPLTTEIQVKNLSGEEEILGNIALGYLSEGVSAVDMAGYYQIFANGGSYEQPKTVYKIVNAKGDTIYERSYSAKQVISKQTADIMNRLLREVVKKDATGSNAALDTVQVAGKTGTGDNNSGNWFVGVTPQYSCAVYHGSASSNEADFVFATAMKELYNVKPAEQQGFINHSELTAVIYCGESGKTATAECSEVELGYYAKDSVPEKCSGH